MTWRSRLVVLAALLAAVASGPRATAQSLGAAAQKEKKKRETQSPTPAPKVITQEDLEASRPVDAKDADVKPAPAGRGTFEAPNPGLGPSEPKGAKEAKEADEPSVDVFGDGRGPSSPPSSRASSQAGSRGVDQESEKRAAQERDWRGRGAAARAQIAAAEREVREADQSGGQAVSQHGGDQGQADARARAAGRLATARARLAAAKRNLELLEESARRQGIPPGWLR